MEKELHNLMRNTLRERFELADAALRQESGEYAEMTKRLVELSEKINNASEISTEMKAEIADYLALVAAMDDVFRECLYTKGAKDCVATLRELDLIKYASGGG